MTTPASKMNRTYWRKRALQQAERQIQTDAQVTQGIKQDYERLLHELDKELAVFYARYAQNEGVTMVQARRLLRDAELESFRISLDEFREKAIVGGFDKELDEIYLRSRVSRLQALQTQIELRIQELFQSQEEQLRDHLAEIYTDTYYQTVYAVSQQAAVRTSFARIDTELLEHVLTWPWLGSDFSSRIWADKDKLLRELKQELSRAFVLGEPLKKTTKRVAERMGVSERRAATLVQTESAHMAAQAAAKGYEETGVNEYQFDASLDLKTCPTCGAIDGKTFRVSERETGVNFPPLHPRCRCTTVPVTEFDLPGERAARNPVTGKTGYIEQGMTYSEWHKKYVEGDTVDKSTKSAIIENEIKTVNGEKTVHSVGKIKPKQYEKLSTRIRGENVVLTDERVEHIIERRGEADYAQLRPHFAETLQDPDYIFRDKNEHRSNTALVCKKVCQDGRYVNVVLKLAVEEDDALFEHSIITAMFRGEKSMRRTKRTHELIYERKPSPDT